jgi:chemotaxis response regulator CheB
MARVLLVSDDTLFGRGVECLLAGLEDVEVVGWTEDPEQAVASLETVQPDVIVLSRSGSAREATPALLGCLESGRIQKIISVDLRDNTMFVFTSERRVVEEVGNLVEAITQTVSGSEQLPGAGM